MTKEISIDSPLFRLFALREYILENMMNQFMIPRVIKNVENRNESRKSNSSLDTINVSMEMKTNINSNLNVDYASASTFKKNSSMKSMIDDDDVDVEYDDDDGYKEVEQHSINFFNLNIGSQNNFNKYTQLVSVLVQLMQVLKSDKTISLRDIYYTNKNLFNSQQECNNIVLQVGKMVNCTRYDMGVRPVHKGFVNGAIEFRMKITTQNYTKNDNEKNNEWCDWISCSNYKARGCTGIPISSAWTSTHCDIEVKSDAKYLLIIEKDGIFHRLCEDGFEYRADKCILVCGCGVPDVATRAFVKRIHFLLPHIKVRCLVDFNPYGLGIVMTYKFGNYGVIRTGINDDDANYLVETHGLGVESLQWIGLRADQLKRELEASSELYSSLTSFSKHDINKAHSLLNAPQLSKLASYQFAIREMLDMNVKCDLEAFFMINYNRLSNFVENALLSNDSL